MRSFGLIEKCEYKPHRVLTQEKSNESVMKFYFLTRNCTQPYTAAPPHTAPVAARNALVWAHSHPVGVVSRPAKYCPKFPAFGAFCPRTAFPVQALPGRVSPVQEKPAQINTK